jgi:hypothetical protein
LGGFAAHRQTLEEWIADFEEPPPCIEEAICAPGLRRSQHISRGLRSKCSPINWYASFGFSPFTDAKRGAIQSAATREDYCREQTGATTGHIAVCEAFCSTPGEACARLPCTEERTIMTNRKLFVGNLSARVTEDGLRFLFSKQGEITEIALTVERTAGRSRAFALITMATLEGAEAAIESLHRHIWNGRHITVNEARTDEVQNLPIRHRLSISARENISPFFPIRRNSGT